MSHPQNYSDIERMEGKPVRDDLIELCRKHNLGSRNGGWSAEQVALYLQASLHALHQISPERWSGHTQRAGN